MKRSRKIRTAAVLYEPEFPRELFYNPPDDVVDTLTSLGINVVSMPTEPAKLLAALPRQSISVALLLTQGIFGSWGSVQGLLDARGVAYVGSGVNASALAANKLAVTDICTSIGIKAPRGIRIDNPEAADSEMIEKRIGLPAIVKPLFGAFSLGMAYVSSRQRLREVLSHLQHLSPLLVEEYIDGGGREYSVGVLEMNGKAVPLPTTEIPTADRTFGQIHKFNPNGYKRHTPAHLPPDTAAAIADSAIQLHTRLGCRGLSRTDILLGPDGEITILELNSHPGLTRRSLFPEQCTSRGIDYAEMLTLLLREALRKPPAVNATAW
jgi:D-alanine-D-alanine ligase